MVMAAAEKGMEAAVMEAVALVAEMEVVVRVVAEAAVETEEEMEGAVTVVAAGRPMTAYALRSTCRRKPCRAVST